jgi:hypothetical protein
MNNTITFSQTVLNEMLRAMIDESPKTGAIPDAMVYWSSASGDAWGLYANVAATTNSWEMKVDFHD